MEDTTFTAKAVAAIVVADEKIVTAEVKAFGAIVATYCELGTKVRALPGFLGEDGNPVRGMAAKVLEAAPTIAQSRLSRAVAIAGHGKDGYEAYRADCKERSVVPSLTGLMGFYSDAEATEAPVLTGKALVDAKVAKVTKALDKACEDLNTRQRKAVIAALIAALDEA